MAYVTARPPTPASDGPRGSSRFKQARRAGREHLEQPALGLKVRLHVGMEIEMIACEVREHRRGERHAVHAAQRQRVRRHLHRRRHGIRGRPSRAAAPERPVLPASCVRPPARPDRRADAVRDGAKNPAADARRFENRREQIRRRRLSVRAGDADHLHVAARVLKERISEQRQSASRASLTMAHGTCTLRGAGCSDTIAAAPRSIACRANAVPSAC